MAEEKEQFYPSLRKSVKCLSTSWQSGQHNEVNTMVQVAIKQCILQCNPVYKNKSIFLNKNVRRANKTKTTCCTTGLLLLGLTNDCSFLPISAVCTASVLDWNRSHQINNTHNNVQLLQETRSAVSS